MKHILKASKSWPGVEVMTKISYHNAFLFIFDEGFNACPKKMHYLTLNSKEKCKLAEFQKRPRPQSAPARFQLHPGPWRFQLTRLHCSPVTPLCTFIYDYVYSLMSSLIVLQNSEFSHAFSSCFLGSQNWLYSDKILNKKTSKCLWLPCVKTCLCDVFSVNKDSFFSCHNFTLAYT